MQYLKTRCRHIPEIHNAQQANEFFLHCKKIKTLELVVENVFRRNDVSVKYITLSKALEDALEGDYPSIVQVFLESAIEHRERILEDQRFEDLRNLCKACEV